FELRANGRAVAASSSWYEPVRAELAEHLVAGVNELRVAARNDYGPAGLLVELALELEDGARVHVVSDEGWICTSERPADWDAPTLGKAVWWRPHGFGARGVAPWGDLEGPPPNVIQVPGPMSWPPGLQPPALRDGPRVWVPTVLPDELLSKPPGITILPPLRVTPPEELVREQLRKELEERMRRRLAPRADDEESDPSPAPEDAPAGSPEERP
ncbi:MAG: hypothetical protein KJT03_02360, partial [Verrucomicrobiae bacterium]|nr:hypothetical protein [Verrucomicrobiae bacterium]